MGLDHQQLTQEALPQTKWQARRLDDVQERAERRAGGVVFAVFVVVFLGCHHSGIGYPERIDPTLSNATGHCSGDNWTSRAPFPARRGGIGPYKNTLKCEFVEAIIDKIGEVILHAAPSNPE